MKYKYVTNEFKTRGCRANNPDSEKWVIVINRDDLECNGDYSVKDGVSLFHKDSILGKHHFRRVDE